MDLRIKQIFGLRSDVKGNVHFKSDQEIVYPAAGFLVVQDIVLGHQKYLRLPENLTPEVIVVSPDRKLLAVSGINSINNDRITIYNLELLAKIKSLSLPEECPVQAVNSMCFNSNSNGIAVLSKEPDVFIVIYTFGRNKTVTGQVVISNEATHATLLLCNPRDNILAIGGEKMLEFMTLKCSPLGTNKGSNIKVTSIAWLTPEILIAGTADMDIFFVEGGELKVKYDTRDLEEFDLELTPDDDDLSRLDLSTSLSMDKTYPIKCLMTFQKGFAFATNNTVHVFQRLTPFKFAKTTLLTIPPTIFDAANSEIECITVNPNQDTIAVTAQHSQIYIGQLFKPEVSFISQIDFKPFGELLHIDSILDMSICSWKPIVMTVSKDQTVRVWNYETMKVELLKKYFMDIRSIALHPSGMYGALGFTDALRLVKIQHADLKAFKSFNHPMCSILRFSHFGHLLAAGCEKFIAIVSVFTLETLMILRGHKGVLSLSWSEDDKIIVSSGSEGSIYRWDISANGKRVGDFVDKKVLHKSIALTKDSISTIAVSQSGFIRELRDSQIFLEFSSPDLQSALTTMVLSRSERLMFTANENGSLYSIKMPFSDYGGGKFATFRCHDKAINRLCITHDDQILISAGDDGTLVFWTIANVEDKNIQPELGKFDDVVISSRELQAINAQIALLQMRNDEQVAEFLYEKKYGDSFHSEHLHDIHVKYCNELEELKQQNETIQELQLLELNELKTQLLKLEDTHPHILKQVETKFAEKIILEHQKLTEMRKNIEEMKDDYEAQLENFSRILKCNIEPIEKNFKEQINDQDNLVKKLLDQIDEKVKDFDEYRKQVENDHRQSLVNLQLSYEDRLRSSNELINHWRLQGGVFNKKNNIVNDQCKEFRKEIVLKRLQFTHFESVIKSKQMQIEELKHERSQGDKVIVEKKKQLGAAAKRTDELEKYKQAMTHEMYEMKNQIEPRNAEIRKQQNKIYELQRDLKVFEEKQVHTELKLSKLLEKLFSCEKNLKLEQKSSLTTRKRLKKIHTNLYNVSALIQNPQKLKQEIILLRTRYASSLELLMKIQHDKEIEKEFLRQQEHCKKSVSSCDFKSAPTIINRNRALMDENMKLIVDLNKLRIQVKEKGSENDRMKLMLGASSKDSGVVQQKISKLSSNEIDKKNESTIRELEEKLEILFSENQNLQSKIKV